MGSDIGERIRELRLKKSLTMDELAKRVGYNSRASISRVEHGETDLPLSKVKDFAKALGTSSAYLMGWTDDPQDSSDFSQMERVAQWQENNPYLAEEPQYYTDPDVSRMANELKDRPDLRVLLDASRDLSKDDMFELIDIINRIKDGTWKE